MEKQVMEIKKRLKEIAGLLWDNGYNGAVYFDHKSYEDDSDIPRIKISGDVVLVSEFHINKVGDSITICDDSNNVYSLWITGWSDEWSDSYYESIGLFDLLRDVYYETKESYEIGDYELDFINH